MKRISVLTICILFIATACYSQLNFKNLKADIKLSSGLNTSFNIGDHYQYDYNVFSFSYNGGLETSIRYCFQDSRTDVGVGIAYSYQPTYISFSESDYLVNFTDDPQEESPLQEMHYSGQYKFHYINIPINFYYNTKSSYIFNYGIAYKVQIHKEISKKIRFIDEDYINEKFNHEFILGVGKRLNTNFSIFFKTNIEMPGVLKMHKGIDTRIIYSNFNTNMYLVYTF